MSTSLAARTIRPRISTIGRLSVSCSKRAFRSTVRAREQFHDANVETFQKAVSAQNSKGKVVLVDFYADWCGPCKMLSPVLDKLTDVKTSPPVLSGSGCSLDLVTVDTDKEVELAQKYKIRSLPTVIAFKDGEIIHQFIGAMNEDGVRKFVAAL